MFEQLKAKMSKVVKALTTTHSYNPKTRPIDPLSITAIISVQDAVTAIRRLASSNSKIVISPTIEVSMHGRKRMHYKSAYQQYGQIKCVSCGSVANACVITPLKEATFGYVGTFAHVTTQGQAYAFTIDHVVPKWGGGTLRNTNCQIMCEACNQLAGSKLTPLNRIKFVFKALFA